MFTYDVVVSSIAATISDPFTLLMVFVGTFMGLTFGTLPGLTATMGIALMIPLTYSFSQVAAIGMLFGIYVGGIAGGAVASILINIPGTPNALVTTFDGYPMAQQGRAAEAMGWAAIASFLGSLISWVVLVFFSSYLAQVCVSFSSPEYAALALLGLSIVASISEKNAMKSFIMLGLGLIISMIGQDPIYGASRFTFGQTQLLGGLPSTALIIGLFSIPQVLNTCTEVNKQRIGKISYKNFVPSPKKIWKARMPILLSSIIGTVIGIIPAVGGSAATFMAYDQVKRFSKDSDTFGKGNYKGIIASEASNNAVCGGAAVPLFTLGIPGDSVTAVLLGGLMIQGLQPGPKLYTENPSFVIGAFTTIFIATVFMVVIQLGAIKFFVRLLDVPNCYLVSGIIPISLIGAFALRNNYMDVVLMLGIGILAYFLRRGKFPVAPCVLGIVLGTMFEREMRIAIRMSSGDWSTFFTRPVSCVIIIAAVLFFCYSMFCSIRTVILDYKTVENELVAASEE